MEDLFLQNTWNKFDKQIALIGPQQEFLIKSMANAFRERKFVVHFVDTDVNAVSQLPESIKMYLLVVDAASRISKLLIYLKDLIFEKNVCVCVVCEKTEISEIEKCIPRDQLARLFFRPINVNDIVNTLNQVYERPAAAPIMKKILIIDDDPEFLKHMQQILKKHYKVFIANSGAAALMILAKYRVDLILLDYEMPVLDGPKTLEILRTEADTADIPVMFLTGKRDMQSVATAIALKPEKYLLKTMAADDILAVLSEYLSKNIKSTKNPLPFKLDKIFDE